MDSVYVKLNNQFDIERSEKLVMLRRAINCLSAHPDNQPDSEFADRIADLELIIKHESRIFKIQLPTEEEIQLEADEYDSSKSHVFENGVQYVLDHIKKGGQNG